MPEVNHLLFLFAQIPLFLIGHQAALFVHLTIAEFVFLTFKGVGAAFELNANRCTDQLQDTAAGVL